RRNSCAWDKIRSRARLIVVGDRRVFDEGARILGIKPDVMTVTLRKTFARSEFFAVWPVIGYRQLSKKRATSGGPFLVACEMVHIRRAPALIVIASPDISPPGLLGKAVWRTC